MKWNWKSIQLVHSGKKLLKLVCLNFGASPSKKCAKHTEDKPLISFPSWLTLWTNTINPSLFCCYNFLFLLPIEIIQFNSRVSKKAVPLMARKSSRKTRKNTKKKPASQFQRVTTLGPEVRLCTYVHFSCNFFFYFFIRSRTEASLFWASLVLVLDILCSVLHRFWLFYLKGL